MNIVEMVRRFHKQYGVPTGGQFDIPQSRQKRISLLYEEFQEYIAAENANDRVAVADALADIMYIICGTAIEYDIPLNEVFVEVHRSNMSKLTPDGKVLRREDGKILKPEGWTPPDIRKVLRDFEQSSAHLEELRKNVHSPKTNQD